MKKLIIGLVLLMLLVACAPATEKAPETTEKKVEEKTETVQKDIVETTEDQDTEVGRTPPKQALPSERKDEPMESEKAPEETKVEDTTMNPKLRDLLKRADEKLKSVQYLYGGPETQGLFLDTYMVMGDKIKIAFFEEDYYVRENHYTHLYVNEGAGCCEVRSRCISKNIDNTNKKIEVDVSTLNVPKTPYQWSKEIPSDSKILGPQTVELRSVTHIKYNNGADVQMWIDDTYGVPLKIVVTDANGNEKKYQYNDVQFNSLKESDFMPPCA